MRYTPLDVQAVQPRSIAAAIRRQVEHRPRVHENGIADAGTLERDPLRHGAIGAYAPEIHFVRHRALNEVDEGLIARPHGEMRVTSWRRDEDLPPRHDVARGGHEHRIAWSRRVIDETAPVAGPIGLGRSIEIRPDRSAQRRNRPDADGARIRSTGPPRPDVDGRPVG